MVIESYHKARNGQLKDLVDKNTGEIIYPFSRGCVMRLFLNTDEFLNERETLADENNSEGEKYYSLYKLENYKIISAVVPDHVLDMLYTLKVVSDNYLIHNSEKIKFSDIIVTEDTKSDGATGITIQLLIKETTITGNY